MFEIEKIKKEKEVRKTAEVALKVLEEAQEISAIEVCDESIKEYAVGLLTKIAEGKKKAEAQRQLFVGPLNQSIRAINSFFKKLTEPLEEADAILRKKILEYRMKEEERIRKEAEEIRKKMEEKGQFVPVVVSGPGTTMSGKNGTAIVRKVWDFEVIDENQVPREYLSVDPGKIRKAVQEGVRQIPGVKIFQKEVLAVQGGKR